MEERAHMTVGHINYKGYRDTGFRVSTDWNRSKKELGASEGGVKHGGPLETLAMTFQGVGQRS